MKKNFVYILSFALLFTTILSFNYFQSLSQHWSSIIDFDLTVIYNSLQIISGQEQDFREHPGYSQFLIYGFFFKILALFDSSIIENVDQLLQAKNINDSIGKLFFIGRFANTIFLLFTIIFFSKICKLFEIKDELILFGAVSLVISKTGIDNLLILRADIIAVTFMLGSIYYILSFIKCEQKLYKLLISSFFLVLSLLAKIQIIILLIFILAIIPFFIKNEYNEKLNQSIILRYFNFYLVFYILIFTSYLILQYFIYSHPRFEDQNYIDVSVFIFFNVVYFIYLFFISLKKKNLIKVIFSILILLLLGVILSLGFLLLLSYFEIFKLSPYILMRLTNPFYYLKVYSPLSVSKIELSFIANFVSTMFNGLIINIKSLLILIVAVSYSLRKDLYSHKKKDFEYKIIFFISIMMILFSFNLRYLVIYDMYYLPFYYLLIIMCLNDFKKPFLILSIVIIFLANNQLFFKKYDHLKLSFKRSSNLNIICTNKETRKFIWWWARGLDENFFKRMCNQEKIKFIN
jgi:hypothetical protein